MSMKALKISSILLFTIVLIMAIIVASVTMPGMTHPNLLLTTEEARRSRFGMIIDVRSPKERETLGYYPNSIPLDLDTLPQQIGVLTSKATSIMVYSNGDSKAQKAAERLYDMGYHGTKYIATTYQSLMPGQ